MNDKTPRTTCEGPRAPKGAGSKLMGCQHMWFPERQDVKTRPGTPSEELRLHRRLTADLGTSVTSYLQKKIAFLLCSAEKSPGPRLQMDEMSEEKRGEGPNHG